jgi:hypothetical protein
MLSLFYHRLHSAGHLLDICVSNVGLSHLEAGKGYHFPDGYGLVISECFYSFVFFFVSPAFGSSSPAVCNCWHGTSAHLIIYILVGLQLLIGEHFFLSFVDRSLSIEE